MTRHLAKLLDAVWYVSMGLFLGLTGGLVLSVILTFRGSRAIDASPGVEPYSDPMFAEHHNDAVAGYIGQDLFSIGGTAALVLFTVAFLARAGVYVMDSIYRGPFTRRSLESAQGCFLGIAALHLILASWTTTKMNQAWPAIYDQNFSDNEVLIRRSSFDALHRKSESRMALAWTFSFLALAASPWSRRPEKTDLQSGDDQEESNTQENREAN